jgi:hypothetical protein
MMGMKNQALGNVSSSAPQAGWPCGFGAAGTAGAGNCAGRRSPDLPRSVEPPAFAVAEEYGGRIAARNSCGAMPAPHWFDAVPARRVGDPRRFPAYDTNVSPNHRGPPGDRRRSLAGSARSAGIAWGIAPASVFQQIVHTDVPPGAGDRVYNARGETHGRMQPQQQGAGRGLPKTQPHQQGAHSARTAAPDLTHEPRAL